MIGDKKLSFRLAAVLPLLALGACAITPVDCPDCVRALTGIAVESAENVELPRLPVYAGQMEPSLYVNSGYQRIYRRTVRVAAGDVLRIRAQVETSNPNLGYPVRGHLRLLANGAVIGTEHSQDNVAEVAHHMPLWTDAVYRVTTPGDAVIEAQYSVTADDAPPALSVVVNAGYGHLVIEHYRGYPSVEAAGAAGARLLAGYSAGRNRNATAFFGHRDCNGSLDMRTTVYDVSVPRRAGDLVRLLGQATTGWAGNTRDERAGMAADADGRVDPTKQMHGQGIFVSGTERRLGPWATENVSWSAPHLPLWTDAVDSSEDAGETRYSLTVHGCYARFARIHSGAGHLYAMQFSWADDGGMGLADSSSSATINKDGTAIQANSGWQTVAETQREFKRGDVVRVTGYVELEHPGGDAGSIYCRSQILPDGKLDASSVAMKYLTQRVTRLPLRNEVVATVRESGMQTLRLRVECEDDGKAAPVSAVGGRAQLLVDHYRPVR